MVPMELEELKRFIIAVIDEEFAPHPAPIAPRWAGGKLVMTPGGDTQPKEIPLEIFFKKILGIRDSLRVLEQKINSHAALGAEDKATMQGYITKCYGSLTTFNVLFKEDKHKFVGSGAKSESETPRMSVGEAKKKLGLNEYGNE